jgi:phosphatidylserine/phosphatidylglycerophosphate/cardiolipin synthase-like enzyme
MEFDEMWGGSGDVPVPASCRFGSRKTDNTPHRFMVGTMPVECYFSPSDGTTGHIREAIDSAGHSVAFALLTMTRSDLSTSLIARRAAGVAVRGVIDNSTDSGTQYFNLVAGGVDVQLKPSGAGYLLHHKYAIIDAEDPAWDPVTVTGSHNWSNAAENANDENTLILASPWIANFYLQEFTARYYEYGGQDTIRVGVDEEPTLPAGIVLYQNFPNPFNPETHIRYELAEATDVRLAVYSLLGEEVALLIRGPVEAGRHETSFDGRALASGLYILRLTAGGVVLTRPMILLK